MPDPRKLKNDLAALHDAEVSEKAAIRALEIKLATHAKQREALERVERDVDEVVAMQQEVEGEQAKLKDLQKQIKENGEAASRDDSSRNDQQHAIKGMTQRVRLANERLESAASKHAESRGIAAQAHADTRRRWSVVEEERGQQGRHLEDNETIVRELRDKLLRGRMEHEAEVASVQQQQQLLAAQVRAYHQDLQAAMKTVTTSNAVLAQ